MGPLDEMLRVVNANGAFILKHTGYAREVPWLNEQYKAACAEQEYCAEHIGARSTRDVLHYARTKGCQVEEIQNQFQRVPAQDGMRCIQYRLADCRRNFA